MIMHSPRFRPLRQLLLPLLLLGLAACSSGAAPEAGDSAPDRVQTEETDTGETAVSTLSFYNWDTYIDPQILQDFETAFGVTVLYQTYDNDDALYDELQNGASYDLIVPSDFYVAQLRQEGLLAQLDKTNIPNLANLDPAFTNPVHDPENRYCVPYQWGTVGIGYNASALGEIASWDDVFDPAHAGRVALLDDRRTTLGLILLYLGYSPNTTNKFEIAEAGAFLQERADVIAAYHGDDGQDLLNEGVYDVVLEYSGDVFQVMADNPDLRYLVPPSGSNLWTDNICIPASSTNKALAEAFINYLLEPEVSAALSTYVQYGSPNQAAIPLLAAEDRNNPAIYPPPEVRALLFPFVDLDDATETYYREVWDAVLASVAER